MTSETLKSRQGDSGINREDGPTGPALDLYSVQHGRAHSDSTRTYIGENSPERVSPANVVVCRPSPLDCFFCAASEKLAFHASEAPAGAPGLCPAGIPAEQQPALQGNSFV